MVDPSWLYELQKHSVDNDMKEKNDFLKILLFAIFSNNSFQQRYKCLPKKKTPPIMHYLQFNIYNFIVLNIFILVCYFHWGKYTFPLIPRLFLFAMIKLWSIQYCLASLLPQEIHSDDMNRWCQQLTKCAYLKLLYFMSSFSI